jgi:hypothetical protein
MVTREIAQCYRDDNSPDADYYETTHSKEELRSSLPVLRWIDDLTEVESVTDISPGYGTLLLYAIKRHNPAIRTAIDPVGRLSTKFVKVNQIDRVMGEFERQLLLSDRQFEVVIVSDVRARLNYAPGPTLRLLYIALTHLRRRVGLFIISPHLSP